MTHPTSNITPDRMYVRWHITSDVLRYLTKATMTAMRDELQEAVPADYQGTQEFITLIDVLNEVIQEN